ncbi:MAG: type II secretion system F family protein [Candidatus Omnitrophica bacterium]|nr:type II secretion system F family protein [Candidatus Omnitrophota bacterium]
MFSYTAKDALGKTRTAIVEALDEQALVEKLQGDGYFVLSVKPASPKMAAVQSRVSEGFTHKKVKIEDMLVFARQLATMLEAGVTLLRSLDVISAQVESKELGRVLKQVRDDVEQGKPLSGSLAKHPKVFSPFWVSLVEVGEASGTMPMVLNKLAFYTEQEAAFRSTIVSAMIYPAVLFFISIGAVLFFALFVGPKFETIFKGMGTELPGLTVAVLGVFYVLKHHFIWIVLTVAGFMFLLRKYIGTDQGRLAFENVMFHLPAVGGVYKLIVVERFASQMAILMDSGVPILYALEITEKLVSNKTCSLIIAQVRESVREGKLLADPMGESGFFPSMAVQMIKVGEETGELGKMLKHVSGFYQRNVEAFMKRFGTLIEPVMLVFMGGLIGTIVLAMFLPLFSLSGG